MTSAAGQFGPMGDDYAILRRYNVQPLALIAPNFKPDAFAASCSGHQGLDNARQMLWQLTTVGSALCRSLLAGSGVGAILGCFESRDGLFDVLQNKL